MKKFLIGLVAATSVSVYATPSREIVPLSYSFDAAADWSAYVYSDAGGKQLTDNVYGTERWRDDLGHGPAYEWVGWRDTVVNIQFEFSETFNFQSVSVSSIQQGLNLDNIVLPSVDLSWSPDGLNYHWVKTVDINDSPLNEGRSSILLDDLSLSAKYLQVTLRHSPTTPFIFVDEIDFQSTAVPEAGPTAILLALSLCGLGALKSRLSGPAQTTT